MLTDDLETPRLVLTCLSESDADEAYRGWLADPEVNRYLESRFSEPTIESVRMFVRDVRESTHSYLFGMVVKETGRRCGNIKLGPVSSAHSTGVIGLMIGDRTAWGKGYGSEAIRAVTDWAFESLGLAKLTAGSYQVNGGSVGAFLKCGYEIEGVQRSQVLLDTGDRDDVVLLGLTRSQHNAAIGAAQ